LACVTCNIRCCLFVVLSSISMSLDVYLSISHLFFSFTHATLDKTIHEILVWLWA